MIYPQYVRKGLGEAAEFLFAKPEPSELENGVFSKAACKQVEAVVLKILGSQMAGFEMAADAPRGTNPMNRWRTVSSLQKAVRFCLPEHAGFAAAAAYDMDAKYLMRRLMVIAAEDVGVGSLFLMAATLACGGDHKFRKAVGEQRLMVYLAEQLASVPKDRSLTDMFIVVDFDRELPHQEVAALPASSLIKRIEDQKLDINRRMLAAWSLAGSKRYEGQLMPPDNDRDPGELFRYMADSGMSRLMLYVAAKIASRTGEVLWVSTLFMDEWLRQDGEQGARIKVRPTPMPDTPRVGLLLGAAYDMFTREGQTAIRRFTKVYAKELEPFLEVVPFNERKGLMYGGVFLSEGGVLARRAQYANSARLTSHSQAVELGYSGLPEDMHSAFLKTIRLNLDGLNDIRAEVLRSKG